MHLHVPHHSANATQNRTKLTRISVLRASLHQRLSLFGLETSSHTSQARPWARLPCSPAAVRFPPTPVWQRAQRAMHALCALPAWAWVYVHARMRKAYKRIKINLEIRHKRKKNNNKKKWGKSYPVFPPQKLRHCIIVCHAILNILKLNYSRRILVFKVDDKCH